jgi:hypothetical protein
MNKRIFLLLLLGCLFSSPGHADETPAPCASEWKAATDPSARSGTYEEARAALETCEARAREQKKKEFAQTGSTWAAGLDPLANAGWVLLAVAPDGTNAVFGSRRHETRKGSTVAVWLRFEYREAQGDGFKSAVERDVYECARIASKALSVTYYSENNLGGAPRNSTTFDEDKVSWAPVIPGTVGDLLLDWVCKTASKAQPAKTQ